MSVDERWDNGREERNRQLNETDWIQWPKGILSCDMYADWVAYRQKLRDITVSCEDPAMVVFPPVPVEHVQQIEPVEDITAYSTSNYSVLPN